MAPGGGEGEWLVTGAAVVDADRVAGWRAPVPLVGSGIYPPGPRDVTLLGAGIVPRPFRLDKFLTHRSIRA